jgi:hypothetical protein
MKRFSLLIIILSSIILFGCSQQLQSTIPPGTNLKKISKFYVVHCNDEKRGLHKIISDELNSMGFSSTYGEKEDIPSDIDAIVTYVDNWQWDLTNYMVKITITFRKPDGSLLATASSFRTSMVRKNPPEMIRETLNEIFHPKAKLQSD